MGSGVEVFRGLELVLEVLRNYLRRASR